MPVIARFFGITIKMYLRQKEHNPLIEKRCMICGKHKTLHH